MGQTTALAGLVSAANAALIAAGVPNPTLVGTGQGPQQQNMVTAFQTTLNPSTGKPWACFVTAYALPGGQSTPYPPGEYAQVKNTPTLTASVTGNVVTLSGAVAVGVPVHIGLDRGLYDVAYVVVGGDNLTTIATALKNLVNGLAVGGLSATSGVGTVTLAGAQSISAIVAASATITFEIGRVEQRLQLSIWAPNDTVRGIVEDALTQYVGASDNHGIHLSDGTTMDCILGGPAGWSDQSQGDDSLYVSHVFFMCEYPLTRTVTATQIAAGQVTATLAGGAPSTLNTFGS
jgi:hypothetical protein